MWNGVGARRFQRCRAREHTSPGIHLPDNEDRVREGCPTARPDDLITFGLFGTAGAVCAARPQRSRHPVIGSRLLACPWAKKMASPNKHHSGPGTGGWLSFAWSRALPVVPHHFTMSHMIRAFWIFALQGAFAGCRSEKPNDTAADASAAKRPIIDMHLHALSFETWPGGDSPPNPLTGKPPEAKTSADILRLTLEAMDRYNIKLGVLSGRLETVSAWKARATDRFLASAQFSGRPASDRTSVDPSPSLDSLRREHAAGRIQALGEITSPYEGVDYAGPELAPYFALAAELKLPVGVHTGLTFPGAVYTCCPRYRLERGDPVKLDEVLARNRGLKLYIMHMGEMFQESTLAILHMYPQVYIDVAVMDWGMPREQFHANLQALVHAGLGKRIMFGSDQMVWPELIGQAIEGIESASFLTDEQKHDIFYNNAARFLGLPELPVPTSTKGTSERDPVTR